MYYNSKITKIAGAFYTDEKGVVYAILRASGVSQVAAYTHAFYNSSLSPDQRTEHAKAFEDGVYIQELINTLKKAKKTPIITEDTHKEEEQTDNEERRREEERGKNLRSIEDVRRELEGVLKDVDGKDRAAVLVQLAKMMPEERTPEAERVHLYIPFNSDCRLCELFRAENQRFSDDLK